MYIIIAILMFGILIAVHEFGHFTAAKLCGVRVEEFSIGMGPALWKRQRGETLYALRALPLGGYCAMTGEDSESEDPKAFINQKPWRRFIILIAGSFMNFLLGLVLIYLMYAGAEAFIVPTIDSFMDNCPYESESGLQAGDEFYEIDGKRINLVTDVSDFLLKGDGTYDITVLRDGEKVELKDFELSPHEYEGYEGEKYGFIFSYEEANLLTKTEISWKTAKEFSRWVWMGLSDLVNGNVGLNEMSGPIGIVDMMNDMGKSAETPRIAIDNILYFSAFIAINLAIMNMLPIPALDGGRVFLLIVTVIIEAITRRKLDSKYESYINSVGMVLLLGLMALVMFNDVWKLFRG